MGRSKFPGKPSKLVNKKRVSVLNGVLSNPFGDHFTDEEINDVPNERISLNETTEAAAAPPPSTTTTSSIASGHDGDDFQVAKTKNILQSFSFGKTLKILHCMKLIRRNA